MPQQGACDQKQIDTTYKTVWMLSNYHIDTTAKVCLDTFHCDIHQEAPFRSVALRQTKLFYAALSNL